MSTEAAGKSGGTIDAAGRMAGRQGDGAAAVAVGALSALGVAIVTTKGTPTTSVVERETGRETESGEGVEARAGIAIGSATAPPNGRRAETRTAPVESGDAVTPGEASTAMGTGQMTKMIVNQGWHCHRHPQSMGRCSSRRSCHLRKFK